MIQFKEINGTLCKMLEKPDAINEFFKMPCVIAGKYGSLKKYYILDFYPSNPSVSMLSEWFEILGYPVEECSAEWALYQMLIGHKVCRKTWKRNMYCYATLDMHSNDYLIFTKDVDSNIDIQVQPSDKWMEFLKHEGSDTGWQIYTEPKPPKEPNYITCSKCGGTGHEIAPEPKHLLSNARSGDSVRLRNGEIHILDIHENAIITRYNCWRDGFFHHKSHDIDGFYLESKEEHPFDIVELLPKLKVGDWVRGKSGYAYKITAYPSKLLPENPNVYDAIFAPCMGCQSLCLELSDIESKLDPSEVVIHIGCLSGTVTHAITSDDCFLLAKVNDPQYRACCIDMSMLDKETRELVESLLKAQEEGE